MAITIVSVTLINPLCFQCFMVYKEIFIYIMYIALFILKIDNK